MGHIVSSSILADRSFSHHLIIEATATISHPCSALSLDRMKSLLWVEKIRVEKVNVRTPPDDFVPHEELITHHSGDQ